jgi:hypothetical protein
MTFRGVYKRGRVVITSPVEIDDGAELAIRVVKPHPGPRPQRPVGGGKKKGGAGKRPASLFETLKPFIGIIKDAPSDWSRNHDHYAWGTPKKPK